jgi:hypothetical protein
MQAQNCSEGKKSKKADNMPLHQPVPKPVDSASPKNSLIFCSSTMFLVYVPRLMQSITLLLAIAFRIKAHIGWIYAIEHDRLAAMDCPD